MDDVTEEAREEVARDAAREALGMPHPARTHFLDTIHQVEPEFAKLVEEELAHLAASP